MCTRQTQSENGKLIKSLSFGEATLEIEDGNHEQSEIKLGRAPAKLRRKFCAWFSFIYHLKLCKGVKVKKTNWQKSRLAYHESRDWPVRALPVERRVSVILESISLSSFLSVLRKWKKVDEKQQKSTEFLFTWSHESEKMWKSIWVCKCMWRKIEKRGEACWLSTVI